MKLIFLFFALTINIQIVSAQPGTLDPDFGTGGIVNLHPNFTADEAKDIAITTDGKLLLLSSNYQIGNYLLKMNADGTPDLSFGVNGMKQLSLGELISSAIEVDDLNRILVYAVYNTFYGTSMFIYRFLEDGSKDLSFGDAGKTETYVAKGNRALLIQADNKIVSGGRSADNIARIARLNEDGSQDPAFNANSFNDLTTLPNSYIFSIKQQPDGKLLATGTSDSDMFVARFNPNGHLDNTFGVDGIVTNSSTDVLSGQDIAIAPDGKIWVSGHMESQTESSLLVWRFLPDGTPDNTFGASGVLTLYSGTENNFGWFAFAQPDSTAIIGASIFDGIKYQPGLYHVLTDGTVDINFGNNGTGGRTFDLGKSIQLTAVLQSDGNLLFCGTDFENGNKKVAVSRIHSSGVIDSSFGSNGTIALWTIDSVYSYCVMEDMLALNDGKIFCAGTVTNEMVFFRLNSDGTLDSSYGSGGYYVPNQRVETIGFYYNTPAIMMSSDGISTYAVEEVHTYLLGDEDLVNKNIPNSVILHKLNASGLPDTSFGSGGSRELVFHDWQTAYYGWSDLKLMSDGKLLFAGDKLDQNNYNETFIARLKADGTLDSTFAIDGEYHFVLTNEFHSGKIGLRSDGLINFATTSYGGIEYLDVARLTVDGTPDLNFGTNGIQSMQVDFIDVSQLFLQPDNKVLILLTKGTDPYTAMLRLNEDGTIDTNFAVNGYLSSPELIYGQLGAQLQPDGNILFCNGILTNGLGVNKYFSNGDPDLSFGVNGETSFTGADPSGSDIHLVRLQSDNKILIGTEDYLDFFLARLLNDFAVSANAPSGKASWLVYPNPASDILFVRNCKRGILSIQDISGKVLVKESIEKDEPLKSIEVSSLQPGMYFLTLENDQEMMTAKFQKQ